MRQRQELELKKRVVGLLDLNSDWTETEVKDAEDGEDDDGDVMGMMMARAGNGDVIWNGGVSLLRNKLMPETTKEVDATRNKLMQRQKKLMQRQKKMLLKNLMRSLDEYLYGDALDAVAEDMRRNNEGTVTPERLVTRHSKASPSPNKRMVKPSSYLLSPYMNKKTKVLPKINRSEFMIGTSLFAMQRDKIETVFETTSGEEKVFGIRLNMETLSPGLCIDANVVDCWAEILNYEDRFRKDGSLSRHFFPTGCITKSMFDGTLSTYEEKWKSFAAEVSAQFKDNVGGLALSGIDLVK
ncbi:hypothetical protein Tco_0990606 [Tanacetum coccineum]|uniref:Uncharacterized protein n=1 Tax=Tanacetum coccineum TaxID=301880 RepID=A0ABQ5EYA9_9ASTR